MDISNWSKRERILGACAGIFLLLFVISWVYQFSHNDQPETFDWEEMTDETTTEETDDETENIDEKKTIVVDVKGAVQAPGVYEVNAGDRVIDVIERSGGFTSKADQKQINLAKRVQDEMVIDVPRKGEQAQQWTAAGGKEKDGKVPVNSADVEALQQLSGIGPVKAQAIVAYREEHGPFKKKTDLLNVSGIGEKSLENMKDQIVIR